MRRVPCAAFGLPCLCASVTYYSVCAGKQTVPRSAVLSVQKIQKHPRTTRPAITKTPHPEFSSTTRHLGMRQSCQSAAASGTSLSTFQSHDGQAVTLSIALHWDQSREGPLSKASLQPPRPGTSHRLGRRFGADRILENDLSSPAAGDRPWFVEKNPVAAQTTIDWLLVCGKPSSSPWKEVLDVGTGALRDVWRGCNGAWQARVGMPIQQKGKGIAQGSGRRSQTRGDEITAWTAS